VFHLGASERGAVVGLNLLIAGTLTLISRRATALAVRSLLPRVGIVFLIADASVAIATVVGRYPYAVDALAEALVAVAAHLVSRKLVSPR